MTTTDESLERVATSADRRLTKLISFKTASSYWEVNLLEHLIRRSPLVRDAKHPQLGYVDTWESAVLVNDLRLGEVAIFRDYQGVFDLHSGWITSIESIQFV